MSNVKLIKTFTNDLFWSNTDTNLLTIYTNLFKTQFYKNVLKCKFTKYIKSLNFYQCAGLEYESYFFICTHIFF